MMADETLIAPDLFLAAIWRAESQQGCGHLETICSNVPALEDLESLSCTTIWLLSHYYERRG